MLDAAPHRPGEAAQKLSWVESTSSAEVLRVSSPHCSCPNHCCCCIFPLHTASALNQGVMRWGPLEGGPAGGPQAPFPHRRRGHKQEDTEKNHGTKEGTIVSVCGELTSSQVEKFVAYLPAAQFMAYDERGICISNAVARTRLMEPPMRCRFRPLPPVKSLPPRLPVPAAPTAPGMCSPLPGVP